MADWTPTQAKPGAQGQYTPQTVSYPRATSTHHQHHASTSSTAYTPYGPPPDMRYTKRPLGAPAVTELNPKTPSQKIRMKTRAWSLIQKYAGERWREAQRTKWLLDVIMHVDTDYRQYIQEQAQEIENLHQQLARTQASHVEVVRKLQEENEELAKVAPPLEAELREARGLLLDMQNRMAASELALRDAEVAAAAAAEECYQLQDAVLVLAEHDASARKLLSNRAHVMKEALLDARARVRQGTEQSRRHRLEVTALQQRAEKASLSDREVMQLQVQAAQAAAALVERAAAKVQVDRVALQLQAYKEPWAYIFPGKSPTKDKEVARELGLKTGSMNVSVPY